MERAPQEELEKIVGPREAKESSPVEPIEVSASAYSEAGFSRPLDRPEDALEAIEATTVCRFEVARRLRPHKRRVGPIDLASEEEVEERRLVRRGQLIANGITVSANNWVILVSLTYMRVTQKGQVTIPLEVRRALGIHPGSEVRFELDRDGARLLVDGKRAEAEVEAMRGAGDVALSTEEILAFTRQ